MANPANFDPAFEQLRLNMLAMQFPQEAALDMVLQSHLGLAWSRLQFARLE